MTDGGDEEERCDVDVNVTSTKPFTPYLML